MDDDVTVVYASAQRAGDRLVVGDETGNVELKRLLAAPSAKQLRVLYACGARLRATGAKAIAAAETLAGLRELNVAMARLDDAAVAALAASPHLKCVERLDVTQNLRGFGVRGLRALCAPGAFPALRSLAINVDALARNMGVLLDSELATRLTTLELVMAGLGDRHAAMLATAKSLAGLCTLSLASNRLTAKGVAALAGSKTLAGLTALDLGHNTIGEAGTAALAKAKWVPRLARLSLRCTVTGAAATARALKAATALRDLDLSANGIGDDTVDALAPLAKRLTRLNLDWNQCGPGTAAMLATCTELTTLILSDPMEHAGLGDEGATILATAPALASLRVLNLSQNTIGEAGGRALAASPHLRGLERLELRWNHIPPPVVNKLVARFGKRVSVHHQRA